MACITCSSKTTTWYNIMLCVKWQYVSFFFLLVTSQTDNVKLQQRQDIGARLELHIGLKNLLLVAYQAYTP